MNKAKSDFNGGRGRKHGSTDKARWGTPLEGPLLRMDHAQILGFSLVSGVGREGKIVKSHRTVIHRKMALHRAEQY